MKNMVRISEILEDRYNNFLHYCNDIGKIYVQDLELVDFVSYRLEKGVPREEVEILKNLMLGRNDSNNKGNKIFVDGEKDISKESEVFYVIFSVNADDFNQYDISCDLGLSTRPARVLCRRGIYSIGELLKLSYASLKSMDKLGAKSVEEIYETLKKFLAAPKKRDISWKSEAFYILFSVNADDFNQYDTFCDLGLSTRPARALYRRGIYSIGELLKLSYESLQSIDKLGAKSVEEIYEALKKFLAAPKKKVTDTSQKVTIESMQTILENICYKYKEYKFRPFFEAFLFSHNEYYNQNEEDCSMYFPDFMENIDINKLIDYIGFYELQRFLEWMNFDVLKLSEDMLDILSKKFYKGYEVLLERAKGSTLAYVGEKIGVSKERVRQIESTSIKHIKNILINCKYDLVYLIYALRNGDKVITEDEFKEIIKDDFGKVLWYVVQLGEFDCAKYRYHKNINSVVFYEKGDEIFSEENLLQIIFKMPKYFLKEEIDDITNEFANNHNIPNELLKMAVLEFYECKGKMLSKGRITVVFMCEYILKNTFKAGFKIADEIDYEIFTRKINEIFGGYNLTTRALDAKMQEIGVLCDRGKYIHPDYIDISPDIIKEIMDYISNSTRNILSYSEIFEACTYILNGTPITNRYYLQGALKKYGCPYDGDKDYIRKKSNASMIDELDNYIKERRNVYIQDLLNDFPSISQVGLNQMLNRCPNVIACDNGLFLHADTLNLQLSDYNFLEKYLDNICKKNPIGTRLLNDMLYQDYIDFMRRNNINDYGKLFGILKYMFNDKFTFRRPYISLKISEKLDTKGVLLKWLEDYETITLDELFEVCNMAGVKFDAVPAMLDRIKCEFIRVNSDTLARIEHVGITNEVIEKVENNVQDLVDVNNYVPSAAITDYSWYPVIGYEWNPFLLESVLSLSKKPIPSIKLNVGNHKYPIVVYLNEKYKKYSIEQLIENLLKEENEIESFKSKKEILCYLQDKKLCLNKLPESLTASDFFKKLNLK